MMPLFHVNCDDSVDEGGAAAQLIGELQSGEQIATPQSIGQVKVNQPKEHEQQSIRRSERPSKPSNEWWVVQ